MGCSSYAGLAVEVVSLLAMATSFLLYKSLHGLAADFYILYCYALQSGFFSSYAVLRCRREDITVSLFGERYLLLARAVIGGAAFVLLNCALHLIPAADASAIMKSTPVFVTVLAYFLLRERFGPARVAVLFLTLAGVFLICRPSFMFGAEADEDPGDRLTGTLCAFGASIALSFVYVLQRKIRRTPVVLTSLANASVSCVLMLPPVLVRSSWKTADCGRAALLFGCSACVLVGLLLKFKASRMEEAGRLALVSVVDLPFTLVCEMAFMGLEPPWTSYAGSGVIVLSVGLVIFLKRQETARERLRALRKEAERLRIAEKDTAV